MKPVKLNGQPRALVLCLAGSFAYSGYGENQGGDGDAAACHLLLGESVFHTYQEALKERKPSVAGLEIVMSSPMDPEGLGLHTIVNGIRNSPEVFSENLVVKKGELSLGLPVGVPSLEGYRIVGSYKIVQGFVTDSKSVPNVAYLDKVELATPFGTSLAIAERSKYGDLPEREIFFAPVTSEVIKPASFKKIISQEIKRLEELAKTDDVNKRHLKDGNTAPRRPCKQLPKWRRHQTLARYHRGTLPRG